MKRLTELFFFAALGLVFIIMAMYACPFWDFDIRLLMGSAMFLVWIVLLGILVNHDNQ